MLEQNKSQLLNNAGKERSTASAVGLARLVVTSWFGLSVFLFSGCELLQLEQQPSTGPAANYDKPPAQNAAMPAPAPPKKSAEFDAMMERLENRAPAPTITPRSEPIAVAVASPKATASNPAPTPGPARVATPSPGEPLIIRSAPPTPPRAGASQLVATNPPPKSVETPAVAVAPAPARPVQSLVVVGTHKPPPKSHAAIWKNVLLAALVLLLAASFLVSLAPVRERLLSLKLAATVWWSTRKGAGAGKERPKSKGSQHESGPAWINIVIAFAQQFVIWAKSLPLPLKRGKTAPESKPIEEPHRPTPAEMLLKKIGAPPSNDISTSSRAKVEHKPAETSTNVGQKPQETSSVQAAEPVPTVPASAGPTNQPARASAPESPAKSEPCAAPDEKAAARNRVLHSPFAPAIITLMSPSPERLGPSNGEKTSEAVRSAPVAVVPAINDDKGKVEAKSAPEPTRDSQKSQEARKAEEPASV